MTSTACCSRKMEWADATPLLCSIIGYQLRISTQRSRKPVDRLVIDGIGLNERHIRLNCSLDSTNISDILVHGNNFSNTAGTKLSV